MCCAVLYWACLGGHLMLPRKIASYRNWLHFQPRSLKSDGTNNKVFICATTDSSDASHALYHSNSNGMTVYKIKVL